MIRNTLPSTKDATYYIEIPDKDNDNFPTPQGSGFFISSDGFFITANHVVGQLDIGDNVDLGRPTSKISVLVKEVELIKKWPRFDLALLKADFDKNKKREYFKDRKDFPHLKIDFSNQEEGAPVYAYGYPLMETRVRKETGFSAGFQLIPSRITSAIISSTTEYSGPIKTPSDTKLYVIDKSLNYGNSGGPIVMTETGKVIAVCIRFQPQTMKDTGVIIPSLYGITSSLQNIEDDLMQYLN